MKDFALEWARRGKPIFPVNPENKRPRTPHGFKDATTDQDQIAQWWEQQSDSMLGMPTGSSSGVVVLDFDVDKDKGLDGMRIYREFVAAGLIPQDTYTVQTPRGGLHVHLQAPGQSVKSCAGWNGLAGFDIRGDGGYVVLPPSKARRGIYKAMNAKATPSPMPPSLMAKLTKPDKPEANLPDAGVGHIAEGQRNDTLFRHSCKLARAGLSKPLLEAALLGINRERCMPPLPEAEVRAIAARQESPAEVGDWRNSLKPLLVGELEAEDFGVPLWDGIISRGTRTLLSAREKCGKTTLICDLIREMAKEQPGILLGQQVHRARVLIVTEESKGQWANRRDDDGLPDDLHVLSRPVIPMSNQGEWEAFCQWIAEYSTDKGIDMVVIDTWSRFSPVENENDSAQATRAAMATEVIAESDVAVLINHHLSKSGTSRGSTGLPAQVDTLMSMSMPEGEEESTLRIFKLSGRFDPPGKIIAEWDGTRYTVQSGQTVRHAKTEKRQKTLISTLSGLDWPARAQIIDAWPREIMNPPSKSTLGRDLEDLVTAGEVIQSSDTTGGANDPHRYRVKPRTGFPAP